MKNSAAVPSGAAEKRRLKDFIRRSLSLGAPGNVKPRLRCLPRRCYKGVWRSRPRFRLGNSGNLLRPSKSAPTYVFTENGGKWRKADRLSEVCEAGVSPHFDTIITIVSSKWIF